MKSSGEIICNDDKGVWTQFESAACVSCAKGCGAKSGPVFIPFERIQISTHGEKTNPQGRIVGDLAETVRLKLLLQIYIYPLLGFVLASVLASYIGFGDLETFGFALLGLILVVLVSKKSQFLIRFQRASM